MLTGTWGKHSRPGALMAKRDLSCFMIAQLLYEYRAALLDSKSEEGVRQHLKGCERCVEAFRKIRNAHDYLQKLNSLQINPELIRDLRGDLVPWIERVRKWRFQSLPSPARWAIAGVACILLSAALVRGFRHRLPIEKIPLAGPTGFPELSSESQLADAGYDPTIDDMETELNEQVGEVYGEGEREGSEAPIASATAVPATPLPQASSVAVTGSSPAPSPEASPKPVAPKGFVYRLYMFSPRIEELTPELVQKIEALGGKKAGDVQLGWRRANGSYFHFSVPEEGFEQLVAFLRLKTEVRVDKDPHSRVMPKGTVRAILWLEQKEAGSSP